MKKSDDLQYTYQPPFPENYCPDPPAVGDNGGLRDWNQAAFVGDRTPYNTEVTYSCDMGRLMLSTTIVDGSSVEELLQEQKFYCLWNQTWSPQVPVSTWPSSQSVEYIIRLFLGPSLQVDTVPRTS